MFIHNIARKHFRSGENLGAIIKDQTCTTYQDLFHWGLDFDDQHRKNDGHNAHLDSRQFSEKLKYCPGWKIDPLCATQS